MTTSLEPVLTTTGVNGAVILSFSMYPASSAALIGIFRCIFHVVVGERHGARAVGDGGHFDGADLVTVPARRLLARWGERRRGQARLRIPARQRSGWLPRPHL